MARITGRSVQVRKSAILTGDAVMASLAQTLKPLLSRRSPRFIVVDANTRQHCLPRLLAGLPSLKSARVLEIPAGEAGKSMETAAILWEELIREKADRKSLLINLGGGVVSDVGGFAASCFKRGIYFVNVPTTLVAMADAAIGGKTGVNVAQYKNLVGTFRLPAAVAIDPGFLATLDPDETVSGLAEVAKTGLVARRSLWNAVRGKTRSEILGIPFENPYWKNLIGDAAAVKNKIVRLDFEDQGPRAKLNFGHTLGHALESVALLKGYPLKHGEAVAWGMVCESYLSRELAGLDETGLQQITAWVLGMFGHARFTGWTSEEILSRIGHDKKSEGGIPRFTLIAGPGRALTRCKAGPETIIASLDYFRGHFILPETQSDRPK
jgi:3-dehydroquinate synthase